VAFVCGKAIGDETRAIHKFIGVCPQFDVVWDDLSVEQHLVFYSMAKGVPRKKAKLAARLAAEKVELDGDAFTTAAAKLSGGMRRRLSIAIAMVGNPRVLFFDEPTTGLDPEARRQIWRIIQRERSPQRAIIVTTHSMEEADALCTRIGIMGGGQMLCLGNQMHLKRKYGSGFSVTLQLKAGAEDPERLASLQAKAESLVKGLCTGALVERTFGSHVTFTLPTDGADEVTIFANLESAAFVKDWSISQSSLEEVFIRVVEANEMQSGRVHAGSANQ